MQYNGVKEKMSTLIVQEEMFWRQRVKAFWLKAGDLNTRFFHASATCRSKANKIVKIKMNKNLFAFDPMQIKQAACDYFQDLFMYRIGCYDPVIQVLENRVSSEDNQAHVRPFDKIELHVALQQMD